MRHHAPGLCQRIDQLEAGRPQGYIGTARWHWTLAEWLPGRNRCWYVERLLAMKRRCCLLMDLHEEVAARTVLSSCVCFEMEVVDEPGRGRRPRDRAGGAESCGV